jgi:hypothetical protein
MSTTAIQVRSHLNMLAHSQLFVSNAPCVARLFVGVVNTDVHKLSNYSGCTIDLTMPIYHLD